MEETKVNKIEIKEKWNKQITKEDLVDFKKYLKNKLQQIMIPMCIIINIAYILIGSYLVTGGMIDYVKLSYGQMIVMIINICVIIVLLAKNKYKKNNIHKWLLAIMGIAIFSTIFSRILKISLFGFLNRYEGVLAIAYYVSIAFLTTFLNPKHKKIIVNCIIITGIIQSIYGILQAYNVPEIYNPRNGVAQGLITNPNFFGTYMLLCLTYSLGAYINENKIVKKIIYIISSIIMMAGLLFCNTTSVVVGLIITLIFIGFYCIKKKKILKLFFTLIIVISTTAVVSNLGKTKVIKDVAITATEATEVVKGNVDDKFGSSRMYIWKNAVKIIPKYFFVGSGVDCFYYAFEGGPLMSPNGEIYYDKAHNEYLQILITEGVFGLISYLGLYFVLLKKGIKNGFKYDEVIYVLPIIGYLVQAFFNISVIEVAPIFYIGIGLCALPSEKEKTQEKG